MAPSLLLLLRYFPAREKSLLRGYILPRLGCRCLRGVDWGTGYATARTWDMYPRAHGTYRNCQGRETSQVHAPIRVFGTGACFSYGFVPAGRFWSICSRLLAVLYCEFRHRSVDNTNLRPRYLLDNTSLHPWNYLNIRFPLTCTWNSALRGTRLCSNQASVPNPSPLDLQLEQFIGFCRSSMDVNFLKIPFCTETLLDGPRVWLISTSRPGIT